MCWASTAVGVIQSSNHRMMNGVYPRKWSCFLSEAAAASGRPIRDASDISNAWKHSRICGKGSPLCPLKLLPHITVLPLLLSLTYSNRIALGPYIIRGQTDRRTVRLCRQTKMERGGWLLPWDGWQYIGEESLTQTPLPQPNSLHYGLPHPLREALCVFTSPGGASSPGDSGI